MSSEKRRDKTIGVLTKRHTCLAHPPPRSKSLDRSLHCYRHAMPYMDAPMQGYSADDVPRNNALGSVVDNPEDLRLRRTVLLERVNGSYGFTLQSYGIQYGHSDGEVEVLTYVDFVDENGVAYKAGLRTGDVILSINGTDVERADHKDLVALIQTSTRLRMVVLYEDCARRVDLHMRYITLTQKLQYAVAEFKQLCKREKQVLFTAQKRCSRRRRDKSAGAAASSPHPGRRSRNPNQSAPSTLAHPPASGRQLENVCQTTQSPMSDKAEQFFPGRSVLKLLMKAKLEEKSPTGKCKSFNCWSSCHDIGKAVKDDSTQTADVVGSERGATGVQNIPPPPPPHVTNPEKRHRHHNHAHKRRSRSQKSKQYRVENDSGDECRHQHHVSACVTPQHALDIKHRPRSTETLIDPAPLEPWQPQECACLRSKSFSATQSYSLTRSPKTDSFTHVSVSTTTTTTKSKRWSMSVGRPKTPTSGTGMKDSLIGNAEGMIEDAETQSSKNGALPRHRKKRPHKGQH